MLEISENYVPLVSVCVPE